MKVAPEVSQINSSAAMVEWTALWPRMNWTECISKAMVLVETDAAEDRVIELEDLSVKNLSVIIEPCVETSFRVKIFVLGGEVEEEVVSFGSNRDFMVFKDPRAVDYPEIEFGYHVDEGTGVMNLTVVDVEVDFQNVVDDPACRRVTGIELRYKEKGREDDEDDEVWTVVKHLKVFRTLRETITGMDNLCVSYEVVLHLVGTTGTNATSVVLGSTQGSDMTLLRKAYDTGFAYTLTTPENLTLSTRSSTSFSVSWSPVKCTTGYLVNLAKENNQNEFIQTLRISEEHVATFNDLDPCTAYIIEVKAFLKIDPEDDTLEYVSAPISIHASTDPNLSTPTDFKLQSLLPRVGKSSVTLSWLRNEWPCVKNTHVAICPADEDQDDCQETDTPTLVDDRRVVTFQHLSPCSSYQVEFFSVNTH